MTVAAAASVPSSSTFTKAVWKAREARDVSQVRLMEFLYALTDRRAFDLRRGVPERVPSGLPLAE